MLASMKTKLAVAPASRISAASIRKEANGAPVKFSMRTRNPKGIFEVDLPTIILKNIVDCRLVERTHNDVNNLSSTIFDQPALKIERFKQTDVHAYMSSEETMHVARLFM